MICDFTSFSTVFTGKSYQDDGPVIWNAVYDYKELCLRQGSNLGPLDQ